MSSARDRASYYATAKSLERVPSKTNVDFSKDLFPAMLRDGADLYGHLAEGYWRDIGNPLAYRDAQHDLLARQKRRGEHRQRSILVSGGHDGPG